MTDRDRYWGMMTSRQVRIGSVVALFGLACRHIVGAMVAPDAFSLRMAADLFGAFGGWLLLMWISVSAPGWRAVKSGELDEREIAERHFSYVIAYRVTGFILLTASFYGLNVKRHGWPAPGAAEAIALLWSLAWVHIAMPGIVLAWRNRAVDDRLDCEGGEIV